MNQECIDKCPVIQAGAGLCYAYRRGTQATADFDGSVRYRRTLADMDAEREMGDIVTRQILETENCPGPVITGVE